MCVLERLTANDALERNSIWMKKFVVSLRLLLVGECKVAGCAAQDFAGCRMSLIMLIENRSGCEGAIADRTSVEVEK
jgi:hypothetical protein